MAGEDDKWEVYEDKRGEFRWRRSAKNGNIVGASTEGYVNRASCNANADRHGRNGNPKGLGANDKWDFYKDKRGEHRWRARATNGEIVRASSESYKSKKDSVANAERNGYSE